MKQKKRFGRITAGFCAAATLVAGTLTSSLTAFAATTGTSVTVTALGDDTLALSNDSSAANLVADYLGAEQCNNLAEIGATSSDLKTMLDSPTAAEKSAVENADVILISVGSNDLLQRVFYENTDLVDMDKCATLTEVATNAKADDTSKLFSAMQSLADDLPALADTIASNIEFSVKALHELNPTANIVVQTVNNPLGVDFKSMSVSTNRQNAIRHLYSYLEAALEGGAVSDYDSEMMLAEMTVETGINTRVKALTEISDRVSVSDYHTPYVGDTGEKSIGFYLSNIESLNLTQTAIGQVVMAAAMTESCKLFSTGDGSKIASAYAATGESDNLKTLRSSLDTIITAAAAHTKTMGDADGNGVIDTQDLFLCLYDVAITGANYPSNLNGYQRGKLDADSNGKLDNNDVFLWLYYIAQTGAGIQVDLDQYLEENRAK